MPLIAMFHTLRRGWPAHLHAAAHTFRITGRALLTRTVVTLVTVASVATISACSGIGRAQAGADQTGALKVVTTTGILADLVRQVGGERVSVNALVPDGADPHTYEPSLRDIRDVAYADVAFSNYLLLEEHAIIRALDANLPSQARSVSSAEGAAAYGAKVRPLVEDRALDTVWLGMRVSGSGEKYGADRASEISLYCTGADLPEGSVASAWLTTTFGAPSIAFTAGGQTETSQTHACSNDQMRLPAQAHQHMSWGFTKPGIYRLTLGATIRPGRGLPDSNLRSGTLVVAVGIDPGEIAAREMRTVVDSGHADVTVDLEHGDVTLMADSHAGGDSSLERINLDRAVLSVPASTLTSIPADGFRFLGHPGDPIYLLPQAVLGKHVHGEIDPHLWHDVSNARAYVQVIRDELMRADPEGAATYQRRSAAYLNELADLDTYMAQTIEQIPPERRHLLTTTDAFAYLADAYGLDVAGFLAPNPATEPSLADRQALQAALSDLKIPAVFLEPNLARGRSPLRTIAEESGLKVCPLYGDTLDSRAPTYIDMMRANADSVRECLCPADSTKE